ncbi:hypothetical protein SCYAM73S_03872 [Streptomyces cyaneofuscatus]
MYTSRSTPNAAAFLKVELAVVRQQGGRHLGGHEESINNRIVSPFGADGRVVAAMSVSAPNVVVTAEELLTLVRWSGAPPRPSARSIRHQPTQKV